MFFKIGRERRKFLAAVSLFDVLGPWPLYLVVAEFLIILFFSILYLPVVLADRLPA